MENALDLSVWIIIPVHNRRETTLRCLSHIEETQRSEQFEVLIVDDGSTDGTGEAIRERYPDVSIIEGDGSLWWGGSMKMGMEFAKDRGADVFIWLNDDVLPDPDSGMELAQEAHERGSTVLTTVVRTNPESEYTTRNAVTRWGVQNLPYETDLEIQPCDVTAGKFTAIPRGVVDVIGLPDAYYFPHNYCDFDYTLRAKENGFNCGVYSAVTATDTGYERPRSRLSSDLSLLELIKNTFHTDRHRRYTVRTMYYRDRRFYGPPIIIPYLIFSYHLIKSFGAIVIKSLLTTIKKDHKLRHSP